MFQYDEDSLLKILGWVKCFAKVWYVQVFFYNTYVTWVKHLKPWEVFIVVGRVVVVGQLTRDLIHFECDLKNAQMNVYRKVKVQLITLQKPVGSKTFARIARSSMISQGVVSLKPLILTTYSDL